MTLILYSLNNFIVSFYGFREDWAVNQPLCRFRAYCFIVSCGSICYAHAIQALGRLFITVFYKQKFLVTYQVHGGMIIFNWTLAVLLAIIPLFFNEAYIFEKESRLCTLSTKQFSASVYVIMSVFVFPLIVSIIIYGIIIRYAHSSPRVTGLITNQPNSDILNLKREMKVARNMMITLVIFGGGGLPYLITVLWHGINPKHPPPESFYLLIVNIISCFVSLMVFVLLNTNKEVKNVTRQCFCRKHQRVNPNSNSKQMATLELKL